MNRPVRRRWRTPLVWLAVTVVAGIGVTVVGTGERAGDRCMRQSQATHAGDGVRIEGWSWWPLGARCEVTRRDGEVKRLVVPPW